MGGKEKIEEWDYSRDTSPLLMQLDEEYQRKFLALMGRTVNCEVQIALVKVMMERADSSIKDSVWFTELDKIIYDPERRLKALDEIFSIPNDHSCESCGSTDGQWVHDKAGNGIGIICSCGKRTEIFRSWREEVRSSARRVKK